MALAIHSLSWSIMIMILFFIFYPILAASNNVIIEIVILLNAIIHYFIDDDKANKLKINLVADQCLHGAQIFLTWIFMEFAVL